MPFDTLLTFTSTLWLWYDNKFVIQFMFWSVYLHPYVNMCSSFRTSFWLRFVLTAITCRWEKNTNKNMFCQNYPFGLMQHTHHIYKSHSYCPERQCVMSTHNIHMSHRREYHIGPRTSSSCIVLHTVWCCYPLSDTIPHNMDIIRSNSIFLFYRYVRLAQCVDNTWWKQTNIFFS